MARIKLHQSKCKGRGAKPQRLILLLRKQLGWIFNELMMLKTAKRVEIY